MKTSLPRRCTGLLLLVFALVPQARAQEASPASGSIRGQVIDSESAAPIEGVRVTLTPSPGAAGGDEARELEQTTDATGTYEFLAVPAGSYSLKFTKSGYRASLMTSFAVRAGELNRADFPLPPLPPQATEEMPGFEEFVVEASPMEEILAASRMESDELLNTLNAAEFAKFAASDVADALKFVPGVNVVEGQFAIIRGLEDRYSSTLYNSAVVPSPDPDSQSVQLDLFPSDIVTNLAVTKTFAPDLPSNSSGGSINILTTEYPESFEFKLSAGTGFNSNARDEFIDFTGGSPIGDPTDGDDTLESDFSFSLGGRGEFAERELRFKLVGANEIDYDTAEGTVSAWEPQAARTGGRPAVVTTAGDLSLGQLNLSGGSFDSTVSEKSERLTGYLGLGFDFDTESRHKLDTTYFYTRAKDKAVQQYENGYIEGFDYGTLAAIQAGGGEVSSGNYTGAATFGSWLTDVRPTPDDPQSRGPLWSANFNESDSFDVDRDLVVYQVNGDHQLDIVDGLHVSWAANTARTSQEETSLGTRFWFEPTDTSQIPTSFPVGADSLGPGLYYAGSGILSSENDIHERQNFARVDTDYQVAISPALSLRLDAGYWYERADRDVSSNFLEGAAVGLSSQFAIPGATPQELGSDLFGALDQDGGRIAGIVDTTNESDREIQAFGFGSKATLWDDLDLLAGARFESISIESNNDPFTGEISAVDGTELTFPTKYLFFDRLDNPANDGIGRRPPPGTIFNDQILGVNVPIDPVTGFVDLDDEDVRSLINGKIDEDRVLPSAGFTYRAIEGMNLRGAYSQTVARPSFRELGYYISVEPGSDDLIIGNPQLQLSDVESYDARVEYTWGEQGDLGAVSGFYKTVDDPIESIIVRNPADFTGSDSALYRTFFNNPNQAKLWGIELEGRKNLGFLGPELAQYFSIGGNYTYIWATVDRTETELARTQPYFGVVGEPMSLASVDKSRRLFGQPEWIANIDLSFDHPDWGTKVTLSFFAISDLLDAAGSAVIAPSGNITSITLDRYIDSYSQVNLVASQSWPLRFIDGDVTLKGNVKNLTDSERRIIYDQDATSSRVAEREFKIGLDYSLSLTYSLSF